MKAVGIKTLKAKLSEYIRLAKAGETILITEREDVVVEMRPARRQPRGEGSLEEALDGLVEKHEVSLRSAEGAWPGPRAVVRLPGSSSQAILNALRGDED